MHRKSIIDFGAYDYTPKGKRRPIKRFFVAITREVCGMGGTYERTMIYEPSERWRQWIAIEPMKRKASGKNPAIDFYKNGFRWFLVGVLVYLLTMLRDTNLMAAR